MATSPDTGAARHPIQVVSRRTGLTPEVLRVWEKRYGVVVPSRTGTGRRLYSDADIEHLRLLRQATLAGRRISDLARLSRSELRDLVREDLDAEQSAPVAASKGSADEASEYVRRSIQAIRELDASRLQGLISRAVVVFGASSLIEEYLAPLARQLGDAWERGEVAPHHEHMASAILRRNLGTMIAAPGVADSAPALVVATPSGTRHEIGAMLAAAAAVAEGWHVVYLGPDLPAEDIATAAEQRRATAVAVSIVFPENDAGIAAELRRLRSLLRADIPLLVGGRAAASYDELLLEMGALRPADTRALRTILGGLGLETDGSRS